jgi:hypothetical protein
MRFAVLDGNRVEATPGARGSCPGCGSELIAKCGTLKVWHWAHKGQRHCDRWWENETEWHRGWKNNFPTDWQEIRVRGADGELHIADIKTPKGLVVEFQRSYLKPEEALKRTVFYKPMFWVVDGTRNKTDKKQLDRALSEGLTHSTPSSVVHQVRINAARILREWVKLGVIVALDFGGDSVWLLRRVKQFWVFGFHYAKEQLVRHISEGSSIPDLSFGEPQRRTAKLRLRPPGSRSWRGPGPRM